MFAEKWCSHASSIECKPTKTSCSYSAKVNADRQPPRKAKRDVPGGCKVVQTSAWFRLPGEVKNLIYKCLTDKADFEIKRVSKHDDRLTHWKFKRDRAHLDSIVRWGDINDNEEWERVFTKPVVTGKTRKPCQTLFDSSKTSMKTISPKRKPDNYQPIYFGCFFKPEIKPVRICHPKIDKTALVPSQRLVGAARAHEHDIPVQRHDVHGSRGAAAWLMTCRQMHDEGGQLFYSKATFSFGQQKLLSQFVSRMTPQLAACIETIYVQHGTYGNTELNEHMKWNFMYNDMWYKACENAAEKLTGLKQINMNLRVNDNPMDLDETAAWVQPLLCFKRLNLERFSLTLLNGSNSTRNKSDLRVYAEHLEKEIAGEKNLQPHKSKPKKRNAVKCVTIRY